VRLQHLPGNPHLGYCTNIHAGETWDEISESLDTHVPTIKAAVSPDAPLGLGLRLSAIAAAELARPATLEGFSDRLARLGAYVFTVNAFPYGPFHGTRVKEQVYEPDWRSGERVDFTLNAARVLAALLPENGYGSVSTVPGAFKPRAREPGVVDAIVERLLATAARLVTLGRETGCHIALALEPEPCCFLETVEEAIAFLTERLFAPESVARFAVLARLSPAAAETELRNHIGICYDVCHGAVEFEDPVAALRRLKEEGIAIPKIQLSAAMRVPEMSRDHLSRLQRFDTGIYLHQVVVRNGRLDRFVDLPAALAAFRAGSAEGEWRIHCHVPVFLRDMGHLQSTQDALVTVLHALRNEPLSPHLEVETYTWDVLPERLKTGSKAQDIARELAFVRGELLA
jgi:sugar phosphate isomerase/epimerase